MCYFLSRLLAAVVPVIICHNIDLTEVRANELPARWHNSRQIIDRYQTSTISPTDWKFRSFRSIVKRYDCLSAATETSFDGISPIDRNKFARDLNSCTDRIKDLAEVAPADLETLRQLQTEFATELTALNNKLNRLETDVAKLETQQFSTTTKLTGQAIFAINAGTFGGDRIIAPRGAIVSTSKPNATSLYRVSLDLNTSFSGNDLLKIRLVSASPGSGDNAAGFLEPNFGSVLDFAVPGREQISLGRVILHLQPSQGSECHRRPSNGSTRFCR
jgi:Carbohydrate-selective porin, OprB family